MPKANFTLPDGTKVTIEGTSDDVAALMHKVVGGRTDTAPGRGSAKSRRRTRKSEGAKVSASRGPIDYVRELVAVDYFSTKRGLGEVQGKLEETAHIYPLGSLSPTLFRLVRNKELRRIKEGGAWKYVNP